MIKNIINKLIIVCKFFFAILFNMLFSKKSGNDPKNNVVIVGGNLFNKGAQAMTFTVSDQIKRIYPNHNIYLLSQKDYNRPVSEKEKYNFTIMSWSGTVKLNLISPFRVVNKKKTFERERELRKVLKNCAFVVDVSGYAISSKFFPRSIDNLKRSFLYFLPIMVAKYHRIPYLIFPQSMGPFDYNFFHKLLLWPFLKKYLKYPKKIYTREKKAYEYVKKYTTKNLHLSRDIVLCNDDYIKENIFSRDVKIKEYDVLENSVVIIPNDKVYERVKEEDFYELYKKIISRLLEEGKNIYILRHSFEDLEICQSIKNLFINHEKVKLIIDDLSCLELEGIIKKFDFAVASRYHSVVHCYRNSIPVLCIGWANKYYELLDIFCQLDYFCKVNNSIDENIVTQGLDSIIKNFEHEKSIIFSKRLELLKNYKFKNLLEIN